MLDIERRIDVDPRRQQFLYILVALVVAAARRVGMGQLVDQHQLRPARENGVDVHLRQGVSLIGDGFARHDLEAVDLGLGFAPAVGFDHADHDIDARVTPRRAIAEHLVGLAHARRRPKEYLEAALGLARGGAQQGIGIGPGVVHGLPCAPAGAALSRARLSSSALTRGSPRKPSVRPSTWRATSARTAGSLIPRARAMRPTWK